MKRLALAGLLALLIGSQADAQIFRRYAPAYYSGSTVYSYEPSYYTPGVTTASYYVPSSTTYVAPAAWSSYYPATTWTYPSYSGYAYPTYSSYYSYPAYTSGAYYYPRGAFGRRGYWSW